MWVLNVFFFSRLFFLAKVFFFAIGYFVSKRRFASKDNQKGKQHIFVFNQKWRLYHQQIGDMRKYWPIWNPQQNWRRQCLAVNIWFNSTFPRNKPMLGSTFLAISPGCRVSEGPTRGCTRMHWWGKSSWSCWRLYLQVWIGVIHRVRLVFINFIKLEWTGNAGGLNWLFFFSADMLFVRRLHKRPARIHIVDEELQLPFSRFLQFRDKYKEQSFCQICVCVFSWLSMIVLILIEHHSVYWCLLTPPNCPPCCLVLQEVPKARQGFGRDIFSAVGGGYLQHQHPPSDTLW